MAVAAGPKGHTLSSIRVGSKKLGLSPAGYYNRIKDDPKIPKPIKIGKRSLLVDAEIDAYIEAKMAERDASRAA